MSEDYWKGYGDFRSNRYRVDGYIHNTQEKDDYLLGYAESEYDKDNGHDAR